MATWYEIKDKLLALLDRGEWKHSWHLPKDKQGYISWRHPQTVKKVHDELIAAHDQAVNQLIRTEEIKALIEWPSFDCPKCGMELTSRDGELYTCSDCRLITTTSRMIRELG